MSESANTGSVAHTGPVGGPLEQQVTQVARYITLADSGFTIPDAANPLNDRHLQDINAPGVVGGSSSVLFFRTTCSGNPTFSVRLNGDFTLQLTPSTPGPHAWHEVVTSLKEKANELTLAVSGQGRVTFSDIVILYTSNQVTVKQPPVVHG